MADLSKRVNSIQANPDVFRYPTTSDIEITNVGTSVYWAITAVMGLSTIGFVFWASRLPRDRRIFHYITASITLVACIAYYTMAANLGYAAIPVEFSHQGMNGYREIFYVRYIDWVITTPVSTSTVFFFLRYKTDIVLASPLGPAFDFRNAVANHHLYAPH